MQAQGLELVDDFLKRLAAEVADLHHVVLGLADEILHRVDAGPLQAVERPHVDNWNPDTYLWILQEADVPYVPDEWNKLMEKYGRDPQSMTGMTILGRYLSKMKLK